MRKTFYELLASKEFVVSDEYTKLLYLFEGEDCANVYGYSNTAAKYIDKFYFRELPFRGTALSLNDLMGDIELPQYSDKLEDLYLLCEFLIAVLPNGKTNHDRGLKKQAETIYNNIFHILEQTSHELKKDRNGNFIVVSKNQSAVLAAEIVEDDNIAFDLIEYNHYALKGDLSEKKKILTSIGLYIEPILRDRDFKESIYKQLISDTGFVFNNFHIRHNNLTGSKAQEYTQTLNDDEMEKWYDRAYDLAIATIIAKECLAVQDELKELKNNYKWKT